MIILFYLLVDFHLLMLRHVARFENNHYSKEEVKKDLFSSPT
jgi:hypothetical protein